MNRNDQARNPKVPAGPGAEPVPLFGSWRNAYSIAIGLFAVEIALLYFFTHYFS